MKQEFVTLPREVVEQALLALDNASTPHGKDWAEHGVARKALRAALYQPKNHIEQHLGMVPAGWKLVPIEPTDDMLYDIQEFSHILPPRGKRIWAHMLNAAPQPPAVKESLTTQPQVEQEPVVWVTEYDALDFNQGQGESIFLFEKSGKYEIPLYTHPQPKRQPLTDDQHERLMRGRSTLEYGRSVERAHGIK